MATAVSTMIDADTHVIETEVTWQYIDPQYRDVAPVVVYRDRPDGTRQPFWAFDGQLFHYGAFKSPWYDEYYAAGAPELTNLGPRLRDMDNLGVDIQVIYPSFFLSKVGKTARTELAIMRAYNRWMAEVWQSAPRLRWVLVPPLRTPEALREEFEFGKKHGAVGVLMHGFETQGVLTQPEYDQVFALASDLELAICVHIGATHEAALLPGTNSFISSVLPLVAGFQALLTSDIPARYPNLHFGFVEAGASWVPFALSRSERWSKAFGVMEIPDRPMETNRFWVSCEAHEDIEYLLQFTGPDRLVTGTDYGHSDSGTEVEGHKLLLQRPDIDPVVARKIVDTNARALYRL